MWLLIFQGALHTYNTYTVKQKEKEYICAITIHTYDEVREQLDSGGGGALSQGAGHDGSFSRYAV